MINQAYMVIGKLCMEARIKAIAAGKRASYPVPNMARALIDCLHTGNKARMNDLLQKCESTRGHDPHIQVEDVAHPSPYISSDAGAGRESPKE